MQFHPDECRVMHLGCGNPNRTYTVTQQDGTIHTLEITTEERNLRITVDNKLSFNSHVQNCVNNANRIRNVE